MKVYDDNKRQRQRRDANVASSSNATTASSSSESSSSSDVDVVAEDQQQQQQKSVAREIEFMVEMRCGKCVEKVERSVLSLPGVIQVSASLGTNTVRVLATSSVKTVEEKLYL